MKVKVPKKIQQEYNRIPFAMDTVNYHWSITKSLHLKIYNLLVECRESNRRTFRLEIEQKVYASFVHHLSGSGGRV